MRETMAGYGRVSVREQVRLILRFGLQDSREGQIYLAVSLAPET